MNDIFWKRDTRNQSTTKASIWRSSLKKKWFASRPLFMNKSGEINEIWKVWWETLKTLVKIWRIGMYVVHALFFVYWILMHCVLFVYWLLG